MIIKNILIKSFLIFTFVCTVVFPSHIVCDQRVQDANKTLINDVGEHNVQSCCICLESFENVNRVVLYPCRHDMCSACSQSWFFKQDRKSCPQCYKKVRKVGDQSIDFAADPRSFEEKVETFLNTIERQASPIPEMHQLLIAIAGVYMHNTPIKLQKYLVNLQETMYEDLRHGYLEPRDVHEQVRAALLIKSVAHMSKFMRLALVHSLDILEKHACYWQHQYEHQYVYFLRKPPSKWILGKQQRQEIKDNLLWVRKLQKKYLNLFGRLNIHLNTFDSDVIIEHQYLWLLKLLSLGQELIESDRNPVMELPQRMNFDALSNCMQTILSAIYIPEIELQIYNEVGPHAIMPNFFARNWLLYSVAFSGGIYGVYYMYNNPDVVPSLYKKIFKGIKKFYGSNIKGPIISVKKTLFDSKDDAGNLPQDRIKLALSRLVGPLGGQPAVPINGGQANRVLGSQAEKKFVKTYQAVVQEYQELKSDQPLSAPQLLQLQRHAYEYDLDPIREVIDERINGLGHAGYLGLKDSVQKVAIVAGLYAETMERRVAKFSQEMLPPINDIVDLIAKEAMRNQITAALVASVPALAGGFSLWRGTQYFFRSNYAAAYIVLDDVHRIINRSIGDNFAEKEGQMVYLTHKLRQAIASISLGKKDRDRFLVDIRELESPIAIEYKLNTLDRIRRGIDRL